MLLSGENLVKVLDALAVKAAWASAMAEIGGAETTAFKWLAASRAAMKADDKSSPFYLEWREQWGYFNQHAGNARREHKLSTEAIIRQQIRDGLEVKLYDGAGNPIWLVDPLAVALWKDDRFCAESIGGCTDFPYLHDDKGARIQATRRELVPATTRNLLLQTIPDYQPHSTVDVKSQSVVHVQHSYLRRPPEERAAAVAALPAPDRVDSPVVADMKAKLRASLKPPANPKPDPRLRPVEIFGRQTGDPPEKISAPSDETGLPKTLADHPRAYTVEKPAPRVAPQPNYGRPAERLDQASRGRGVPPIGGFKIR
jgi:hypothetical protein